MVCSPVSGTHDQVDDLDYLIIGCLLKWVMKAHQRFNRDRIHDPGERPTGSPLVEGEAPSAPVFHGPNVDGIRFREVSHRSRLRHDVPYQFGSGHSGNDRRVPGTEEFRMAARDE